MAYIVGGWALSQGIAQVFPVFDIPKLGTTGALSCLLSPRLAVPLALARMFLDHPAGKLKRTVTAELVGWGRERVAKERWLGLCRDNRRRRFNRSVLSRKVYCSGSCQSGCGTPAKSIAVLPFENSSQDPENAYFAEGVQDEILARLSKVADLKVISRTSTQRFKSHRKMFRISRGSSASRIFSKAAFRKGRKVRVTVQLIKAASDAHLWAETYDRKLTDIFAVESEIAKNIAQCARN